MIKANELRIGNWVKVSLKSGNGRTLEQQITVQDIVRNKENKGSFEYQPIPLTPEILGELGFSERSLAFTGNVGFTIKEENFYIGLLSDEKGGWKFHNPHFNLTIKYLHQLQNLYFALTGEELIYKP